MGMGGKAGTGALDGPRGRMKDLTLGKVVPNEVCLGSTLNKRHIDSLIFWQKSTVPANPRSSQRY